jgi:predicted SAM-dependent methyltransferase
MTGRSIKTLYYAALSVPMRLNGAIYKTFRQPRDPVRVHLGCGQKNYVPGWVNVDANFLTARIDLWANLTDGLPFRDASVERFYSFHVIEHLPDNYLAGHFQEMYRALVPGGAIRVGGPNIDNACKKLVENDSAWFSDFPDAHPSIGGKFANFVFCRNEHLTALTRTYLEELALGAGFTDLHFCAPVVESRYFDGDVLHFEHESDQECPHSILVEAKKPQGTNDR